MRTGTSEDIFIFAFVLERCFGEQTASMHRLSFV